MITGRNVLCNIMKSFLMIFLAVLREMQTNEAKVDFSLIHTSTF